MIMNNPTALREDESLSGIGGTCVAQVRREASAGGLTALGAPVPYQNGREKVMGVIRHRVGVAAPGQLQGRLLRLLLAVCLLAVGARAAAGPDHAGTEEAGRAASRNVHATGGTVRTAGTVEGDFVGMGGRVTVDQPVKGDALLLGGSIDVRAAIGDDLRAVGGDINLESTIGGELSAAAGNLTLMPTSRVAQDASLAGGLVTLDGVISGALRLRAQRVVLNGQVAGDVRIVAEQIELGPRARIGGSLRHASQQLTLADGAAITGTVTRDPEGVALRDHRSRSDEPWVDAHRAWFGVPVVLAWLSLLAAAAVFVLVFPGFAAAAPDRIGSMPGLSLLVGLGVMVGTPMLAILLCITLLGIPLGLFTLSLYPLLLLVGYLAGAIFLAQRARAALRPAGAQTSAGLLGFAALALLALSLVGLLPFVGPLLMMFVTVAGLGACVLEWHARHRSSPTMAA